MTYPLRSLAKFIPIVTVLLLIGCESPINSGFSTSATSTAFDPKCLEESHKLEEICIEESASGLDLLTLDRCDWFSTNKDDFLSLCKVTFFSTPEYRMTRDLIGGDSVRPTKFYEILQRKCGETKIGEMTLKEVQYCAQRLIEFNNIENFFPQSPNGSYMPLPDPNEYPSEP